MSRSAGATPLLAMRPLRRNDTPVAQRLGDGHLLLHRQVRRAAVRDLPV